MKEICGDGAALKPQVLGKGWGPAQEVELHLITLYKWIFFHVDFFGTFIVFRTLAGNYDPNLMKDYVQNCNIIIHMLAFQSISPRMTLQKTVC